MKLAKITTFYPNYVADFYRKYPELSKKTFYEQKTALDHDAFGWADYWSTALTPFGYDVMEITCNIESMQRVWARENSIPDWENIDLEKIAVAQIKAFKPEVLWFDHYNPDLLRAIKDENPSIRLSIGWVGSAIPQTSVWRNLDIILSCAAESVEYLKKNGYRAIQLHHGFDPRINERLKERPKQMDFSFIGLLVRSNQYHVKREHLLEQLATRVKIDIFSPQVNWKDNVKSILMSGGYDIVKFLNRAGINEYVLSKMPILGKMVDLPSPPLESSRVSPKLKPFIKPAVFGLEMFQILRDSRMILNIHADSSPRFASNMRLFEITGVGTCMVTDWKENLPELFEPDTEVITYRTVDECSEKVMWLLDHQKEREEIARAGKRRTFRDHTFANRAAILHEIIVNRLKG